VLGRTVKAGVLDLGFGLHGPDTQGHFALLYGMKVKDGRDVDKMMRDTPDRGKGKATFDVDKVGGVAIHKIEGSEADDTLKKAFGTDPLFMAVRDDALFVTMGAGGLPAIKKAVPTRPAPAPLFLVEGSVSRLAQVDNPQKDAVRKVAREVFGPDPKGNDTVSLRLEGGDGLKLRLGTKGKVIAFAAKVTGTTTTVEKP